MKSNMKKMKAMPKMEKEKFSPEDKAK